MTQTADELRAALAIHDRQIAVCPADKYWLGEQPCPNCGASFAGPCWLKVSAANSLVDAARTIAAAEAGE